MPEIGECRLWGMKTCTWSPGFDVLDLCVILKVPSVWPRSSHGPSFTLRRVEDFELMRLMISMSLTGQWHSRSPSFSSDSFVLAACCSVQCPVCLNAESSKGDLQLFLVQTIRDLNVVALAPWNSFSPSARPWHCTKMFILCSGTGAAAAAQDAQASFIWTFGWCWLLQLLLTFRKVVRGGPCQEASRAGREGTNLGTTAGRATQKQTEPSKHYLVWMQQKPVCMMLYEPTSAPCVIFRLPLLHTFRSVPLPHSGANLTFWPLVKNPQLLGE